MDYDRSDSSGTADDLPPSHQERVSRGTRVTGNGRSTVVGALSYPRAHNDMETQIHQLEKEAYSSVLRAFKAQSDAITWEKESLITELRKELRVSDDDHRVLLGRVNADDIIQRIREWRKAGGLQSGLLSTSQPVHDAIPSPTVSASRKKQKISQSVPPLSLGAPSPALHPQALAAPMQPSPSVTKRGAVVGAKGKKPKSGQALPRASSMNPMQYTPTGPTARGLVANRRSSGAVVANEPTEGARLIGRKVKTRWPADKNFYEAVITDYNPADGLHALVYDIHTENETWEWVNLEEIPSEDIQWEGEVPGISRRMGHSTPGQGIKKSVGHGSSIPDVGRGRGGSKNQSKKDYLPSQNGIGKKGSDDIEILHTDTLIKEVERVFGANHPDPLEMEKAKKLLKEHEQALMDAIARVADASDGGSEEGRHPFSHGHGQPMDQEREERNRQYSGGNRQTAEFMAGERRREGSSGDQMAGEGRVASDDQHDGDEDN